MQGYYLNLHDQFFNQLRRRMMDIFDEGENSFISTWPPANMYDNNESLIIQIEVPGLKQKEIELSIIQDTLTISGERSSEMPEGAFIHRQERPMAKFSRTFTLPYRTDNSKIEAELSNGILTIILPKHPEEKPRMIKIR